MNQKRYWARALGVALVTLVSGLMIYDKPPDLASYWQPFLQAVMAGLTSLGLNVTTRQR